MIVITAPTGQIGRQVLNIVLESGEPVRVIVRDPARLTPEVRGRIEVVQGSLDDTAVLSAAFEGADSLFWLVPPDPQATDLVGHFLGFTRPACEAITAHGVQRVVAISSLGRETAQNAGQISASFAMDALIESTGVHYRTVQPPSFMDNMLRQVGSIKSQGAFFLPNDPDLKVPSCATRDIAAVSARLLVDHTWTGQAGVPVLGPEDLSPNDMAEIISEVLERPVRYQRVPSEAYKATLMQYGMSEASAQGLIDMFGAVDTGIYNAMPRTAENTTPTSFRQWCIEELRPAFLA
jgi:uncharacterized protein YbjT (DUF2867 family)